MKNTLLIVIVALLTIAPASAYLYIDTTPIDLTHGLTSVNFQYRLISNTTEPVECQQYIDTDVWAGSWDYKEVVINNHLNISSFYNDNITHYWWVCCMAYDIMQGNCTGDINGPPENYLSENFFTVNDLTMTPLPTGYVTAYDSNDIAPVLFDGGAKVLYSVGLFAGIIGLLVVVAFGAFIMRKVKK